MATDPRLIFLKAVREAEREGRPILLPDIPDKPWAREIIADSIPRVWWFQKKTADWPEFPDEFNAAAVAALDGDTAALVRLFPEYPTEFRVFCSITYTVRIPSRAVFLQELPEKAKDNALWVECGRAANPPPGSDSIPDRGPLVTLIADPKVEVTETARIVVYDELYAYSNEKSGVLELLDKGKRIEAVRRFRTLKWERRPGKPKRDNWRADEWIASEDARRRG